MRLKHMERGTKLLHRSYTQNRTFVGACQRQNFHRNRRNSTEKSKIFIPLTDLIVSRRVIISLKEWKDALSQMPKQLKTPTENSIVCSHGYNVGLINSSSVTLTRKSFASEDFCSEHFVVTIILIASRTTFSRFKFSSSFALDFGFNES